MSETQSRSVLRLPAREIPVPTSVSAEAQAMLALGPLSAPPTWPELDDLEGWKKMVAEADATTAVMFESAGSSLIGDVQGVQVEELDLGNFPVYLSTPDGGAEDDDRVYLDIHGGRGCSARV